MLATLTDEPFHLPGWVYEEKYDGYRILAYKEGPRVTLLSRNGHDRTGTYADVAAAIAELPARTLLLDGEAVAFDSHLRSRFQLLQQGSAPVLFAAFDCLYFNGRDLRSAPLRDRRRALIGLVRGNARLFPSRRLAANGLRAFALARRKGFEGVVAKDGLAPYVEGRSRAWRKVKVQHEEEFVIGGFTGPEGTRSGFGALLLGAFDRGKLRYVGKVGTGFSQRSLEDLADAFRPLAQKLPPFVDPPHEPGVIWLKPKLVAQVSFGEWTDDRRLRHPVFLGLRDDKHAAECVYPAA